MSTAWGPRAHPERCDEEFESKGACEDVESAAAHRQSTYVFIAVLIVMAGIVVWKHLTGW